ncbi:hypothetical protein TNCV_659041 [Trichonephila clavipes]|nr:hypothetical protein TNCV_659041 [Trichonephila clavipes]
MAKKRILTQDEIDIYMNNLDELSEINENGLEYSDDDVDFLPDYVSSIEDSDSDSEISVGFAYKLEIYSGQENNEKYRQKGEPDLEQMFKTKRCKRTAQSIPCKDIRRDDGLAHEGSHKDSVDGSCLTFSEIAKRIKQDISVVLLLFLMPPDLDCVRFRPMKIIMERAKCTPVVGRSFEYHTGNSTIYLGFIPILREKTLEEEDISFSWKQAPVHE